MWHKFFLIKALMLLSLNCLAQEEITDTVVSVSSGVNETLTQTTVPVDSISEEAVLLIPEYEHWERATINGKLKMKGLPLSPGLRIFMICDSLIELSVKAPFMGEVGRIEITPDSVTGINKMNKTYTKAGIRDFMRFYPGGLDNLQNLLLARVVMPGLGLLGEDNAELVDVYYTEDGFAVVPAEGYGIDGVDYGYVVDTDFNPMTLLVIPQTGVMNDFMVNYKYDKKGYELEFIYRENDRQYQVNLELQDIDWNGEALKPIILDKKYTSLSIGEFIRNFGK